METVLISSWYLGDLKSEMIIFVINFEISYNAVFIFPSGHLYIYV